MLEHARRRSHCRARRRRPSLKGRRPSLKGKAGDGEHEALGPKRSSLSAPGRTAREPVLVESHVTVSSASTTPEISMFTSPLMIEHLTTVKLVRDSDVGQLARESLNNLSISLICVHDRVLAGVNKISKKKSPECYRYDPNT